MRGTYLESQGSFFSVCSSNIICLLPVVLTSKSRLRPPTAPFHMWLRKRQAFDHQELTWHSQLGPVFFCSQTIDARQSHSVTRMDQDKNKITS